MLPPQVTTTDDPTLTGLLPQSSRARDLLVVAAALLALVAAAWLGGAVRMDLRPEASGADLLPDGRVAYTVTLAGRSYPGVRVTDLHPPGGTRTTAVWVLQSDDPDPLTDATSLSSAVSAMEASGEPGVLPQSVPLSGLRLLVVLEVQDCAAIADDAQGGVAVDPPILSLQSMVGSGSQIDLEFFSWPRTDLERAGACG